jgi:hypothetical protein
VQSAKKTLLRASLGSTFSQGLFIFPRENELISPWENRNPLEKWGFQTSSKKKLPTDFLLLRVRLPKPDFIDSSGLG